MVEVLQESIVPERLPEIAGVRARGRVPARRRDRRRRRRLVRRVRGRRRPLVLVVGDVAGHGIEAASLMGRVRNGLRAYAVDDADPAVLLRRVHELLRALDPDSMVTAVVACYDPNTRELTWSRAGHPAAARLRSRRHHPLPRRRERDAARHDGQELRDRARVDLTEGSLLVLYTDGLIERRDRLIDEGLDWLAERTSALCRRAGTEHLRECSSTIRSSSSPSADDICVLALRVALRRTMIRVDPRHRHRRHEARRGPRVRAGRAARAPRRRRRRRPPTRRRCSPRSRASSRRPT